MTNLRQVDLATNDLGRDAWGRPKMVEDKSLFHGMFTYNVPVKTWYETYNGTIRTTTSATSVDSALELVAGATLSDVSNLRSYRNLRYEPNRGYLYSTALFLPAPTGLQNRLFGVGTDENGAFFGLESGTLYGIIRTTTLGGGTVEDKIALDTTGVDLSKGNTFDIQFQWRGVGDYKFFINLKEVGTTAYLGNLTALSMANPSLPVFYENENLGANEPIVVGCVDVSSEGGIDNGKTYGSIGISNQSGEIAITGYNQPIIAIRSKVLVNSLINTRDTLALLATGYADQRAVLRIWATRDFTAITDGTQTWTDYGDGHMEYLEVDPLAGTTATFDTAKADLIFTTRLAIDRPYATSALFEGRASIYKTPGDMFVFTIHRETGGNANAGVSYEFAEQI